MTNKNVNDRPQTSFFLPDLCQTTSVFLIILNAELLALLLSLARFDGENFWLILARSSLFIQWVALINAAILCALRSRLSRFSDLQAASISYISVILVTFVAALLAQYFDSAAGQVDYVYRWDDVLFSVVIAAIVAAFWMRLFYLQAQYRQQLMAETESRFQALQARIKPHFLFNSMNILTSLIQVAPEKAEKVVEDLSELFRASLSDHKKLVTLQDEVAICKSYLDIEQLRLGDRLKVDWQIQADLDACYIPPLTLQPLIENAVYHGIQPLVDGGTVTIILQSD
ncbi:MAG: histidine kinase, partial [Gammaproteobacteria bacterium]|nr:histidine kinase [Gammaproteobacteria bacterium]